MTIREVRKPPGMLGLYVRAALPLVPGASRVPLLPIPKGRTLPDLELVLRDVAVERDHVDAYSAVCGFPAAELLPPAYPHILAFPLHMALMTDGSFPFPPVGLVHIENRITVHRGTRADEKFSLRVFASGLEPHPKGRQFSIVTEARAGDELVWEEASTMLRRGSGPARPTPAGAEGGGGGGEGGSPTAPRGTDAPATDAWEVASDTGRRYAAVSGDRNPIHLYDLTAKLFGFPRAIAHGMWTKARCLAQLGDRLPDAYTVDVAFRKPILLPASVQFAADEGEAEIRFTVRDPKQGASHLDGVVTTA